ncbi:hypothetical protein CLIM01_01745 [Colletotrichum limetticola]|uniref:Secreted protein n=1 Tax=Colletotrichum limetticola TaxID=1209924 RepID=A0ABQ9QB06_9PEZI|nr:hypothetical protein CLIM01_01745 [Colletotrichum limetticola]
MKKGNLTPKTITAPLAAFTMACILFAYTRSSIRSARDQAVRLPIFHPPLESAIQQWELRDEETDVCAETSPRPEPWTRQR